MTREGSTTRLDESQSERIGIKELAAQLGVSPSTVSRALSGHPRVGEATRRRVRALAAKKDYIPNRLARDLRRASTSVIGFLVPDVTNPAYSIAASTCAQLLRANGSQLLVGITSDDADIELSELRGLLESRVSSIIIAPSVGILEETRSLLGRVSAIEYNRSAGASPLGVLPGDGPGITAAVDYLADLGHRHLGYIGTRLEISNGRVRVDAFRSACSRRGIEIRPEWISLVRPSREEGYGATSELLQRTARPTALVMGSAQLSHGALGAVNDLGLRLVEDVSLVMYGDYQTTRISMTPLTTIAVPYREMATLVTTLLLEPDRLNRLGGKREPPRVVPTELLVRASTGPPPKGHSDRGR